jgi:thiol-disulfide isomerase/thioredoxin
MIIPEPTIAPDRAVLNRIRERLEMDLVDNTSEYNDGYNGGLNMAICEIGAELENFPFQCHLRCKNHVTCGKSGYDKVCADFAPKQDSSESFSVIDKALLKEWADWCAKCREYMKVTEETLALHGAAIDAEQVSGNQTDQRIIVLAASIAKIESVVKDIAGVLVKLTN